MAGLRDTPEDIVLKLRQVDVLQGQDKSVQEAVCQIGMTLQTYLAACRTSHGRRRTSLN
jgi:hypothetical protein